VQALVPRLHAFTLPEQVVAPDKSSYLNLGCNRLTKGMVRDETIHKGFPLRAAELLIEVSLDQ
jgi:hypothetical protein